MRHLKVDKKNEVSSQRCLSGHMFLNHCLMAGNRKETWMTFPVGKGLFIKTAEPVILCFIQIPAVVLLLKYFLYFS